MNLFLPPSSPSDSNVVPSLKKNISTPLPFAHRTSNAILTGFTVQVVSPTLYLPSNSPVGLCDELLSDDSASLSHSRRVPLCMYFMSSIFHAEPTFFIEKLNVLFSLKLRNVTGTLAVSPLT